jgi:hypothetical protein
LRNVYWQSAATRKSRRKPLESLKTDSEFAAGSWRPRNRGPSHAAERASSAEPLASPWAAGQLQRCGVAEKGAQPIVKIESRTKMYTPARPSGRSRVGARLPALEAGISLHHSLYPPKPGGKGGQGCERESERLRRAVGAGIQVVTGDLQIGVVGGGKAGSACPFGSSLGRARS